MSDKPSKQPLYRWPNRPFWLFMTPLLVLAWLGVLFYKFRTVEQMTSHDKRLALMILAFLFFIVGSLRYAKRQKDGL